MLTKQNGNLEVDSKMQAAVVKSCATLKTDHLLHASALIISKLCDKIYIVVMWTMHVLYHCSFQCLGTVVSSNGCITIWEGLCYKSFRTNDFIQFYGAL